MHSTDPFVKIRTKLANEASARDALIAHEAQANYWASSHAVGTGSYSHAPQTLDAIEAANSAIRSGRTVLINRRRNHLAAAHGASVGTAGTAGYEAKPLSATYYARMAAWHREAREGLVSGVYGLTLASRDLVRYVRNMAARESLGYATLAAIPDTDTGALMTSSNRLPRGVVDGREVRVSERGAYGKRGIRGTATRVSQRDAHLPVWLLRPMSSVGLATVRDADTGESVTEWGAAVVTELMADVRRHPGKASLRLYTADEPLGRVVLASEYEPEVEGRRAAGGPQGRSDYSGTVIAAPIERVSDVVRFAAILPTQDQFESAQR